MMNVSIVVYKNSLSEIKKAITPYLTNDFISLLCICDNSEETVLQKDELEAYNKKILLVHRPDNPGYGRGHNYSYLKCKTASPASKLHLFVNLDITVEAEVISTLIEVLLNDSKIVQLMPKILNTDGSIQRLCKQLPSPLNVFIRRFLPNGSIKQKIDSRYTLKQYDYSYPLNCPYLSGCFMLVQTKAFDKVNGFDERFFMYPEDIDLTRRLHKIGKTLCWPDVSAIHEHGQASYSSLKMTIIHAQNMVKYFNKWGWIYDKEMIEFNQNLNKRISTKIKGGKVNNISEY